jgi:hypothetical protein
MAGVYKIEISESEAELKELLRQEKTGSGKERIQVLYLLTLFWDSGGDRIKIYSLKSRGGIWLSHAQPNQRLNSLMTTAKTIETYFQKLELLNISSIYIWG